MRDASKVSGFWNDLMVLFRMLRARLSGEYEITLAQGNLPIAFWEVRLSDGETVFVKHRSL